MLAPTTNTKSHLKVGFHTMLDDDEYLINKSKPVSVKHTCEASVSMLLFKKIVKNDHLSHRL